MPLRQTMDHTGRPQHEHQVAVAMATLLERFAAALPGSPVIDVGSHPSLEAAVHELGHAVVKAITPNA